jgi:hypothetical protein
MFKLALSTLTTFVVAVLSYAAAINKLNLVKQDALLVTIGAILVCMIVSGILRSGALVMASITVLMSIIPLLCDDIVVGDGAEILGNIALFVLVFAIVFAIVIPLSSEFIGVRISWMIAILPITSAGVVLTMGLRSYTLFVIFVLWLGLLAFLGGIWPRWFARAPARHRYY